MGVLSCAIRILEGFGRVRVRLAVLNNRLSI